MKAVVMAGGFGTRLRPLTVNLPKPMVPLVNQPILAHVLNLLRNCQFKEAITLLYYQPELIKNYFSDGEKFGLKMKYHLPKGDLGTAGAVKYAQEDLTNTFLVISGDLFTNFDLARAVEFHCQRRALATIVLTRVIDPLLYGIVITKEDGRVERFLEKPSWGEVFSDTVNAGMYVLEPEIFEYIPEGEEFDFSKNLFPLLLEKKLPLYGYIAEGYWRDIGNLEEYRLAHYDCLEGLIKVCAQGKEMKFGEHRVLVGEGTKIGSEVKFTSSAVIGRNCHIDKEAEIGRSVFGDNVHIGKGGKIFGCIFWDNVDFGEESEANEAIIGRNVKIGARASINVGAVITDDSEMGKEAVVRPYVKVWPYKKIGEGAVLATSLVWGEKWTKSLFGVYGITGLGNIEITPEFATKVGAAYGAFLGKGAYVITSRDAHPASRMIKRTMISGLLSAGVKVGDLRVVPLPLVRYQLGKEGEAGGIHVRQSPFDARLMDIKFLDADGSDLSVKQEKAIEQLFFREDFPRAKPSEVSEITLPTHAQEYYLHGFLKNLDQEVIRKANFKIVLDYAYSSAALIFPRILGEFGCEVVSLNAFLNPAKITKTSEEFNYSLKQLSHIVTTLDADLGLLFDTGGEKVFLVDERGEIIPPETASILVSELVMLVYPKPKIACPVSTSQVIEEIATKSTCEVVRTPLLPRYILESARKNGLVFLADCVGGFIFPEFQPTFDAMYATVKILELMAKTGLHLNHLKKGMPKFGVVHQKVPCSLDQKGRIMRQLISTTEDKKREFIEGIKIYHSPRDWILLIPDPEEACFHLWAETEKERYSQELIKEYAEKIKSWQE